MRQHNFITGVNLGVTTRLPRCPAMFERKKKEKTYAEVWGGHSATKENYRSVMGRVEEVRVQFLNEASFYGQDGGMMTETSLAQLAQLSECAPEEIALAALGALEKGDSSFRVLFDATRGVKANPRTRPRDQLRCPGIREGRTEMAYYKAKQAKTFCLAGDVAKAHRRFRFRPQDWRFQACQLPRPDGSGMEVWVNKVGTFGHATASYWFARLKGATSRLTLSLMLQFWFFQLIFADDLRWSAAGVAAVDNLVLAVFFAEIVGTPFAWSKFRGGVALEWVGLWCDYARFATGVSEKRGQWLLKTLRAWLAGGYFRPRRINEQICRFTFAFQRIEHLRPFLGPFYAWVASVPPDSNKELPKGLLVVAKFLESQLTGSLVEGHSQRRCESGRRGCDAWGLAARR